MFRCAHGMMLAEKRGKWQECHMADQPQSFGGGIFIVIAIAIGTAVGAARGQSSAGLLIGAAVGILIAVVQWLLDRRRIGR